MKERIITLVFFSLSLSGTLSAQNPAEMKGQQNVPSTPKGIFIGNQYHINPSGKDSHFQYLDSLSGFDEISIKSFLLQKNVTGAEGINYMVLMKRNFIDQKYKIGAFKKDNNFNAFNYSSNQNGNGNKSLGSGNNITNVAPCVNEGFESSSPGQYTTLNGVPGWTVNSGSFGSCSGAPTSWSPGSNEFWLVQTPVLSVGNIGTLPNSPLGGTVVAKLNDQVPGGLYTRLRQTFPVTAANKILQFAYAGVYDGFHDCCIGAQFKISLYDCNNSLIVCPSFSVAPCQGPAGFTVTPNGVYWTNWVVKYADLTAYTGSCVTLEVVSCDCATAAHFGSTYFDAVCGSQLPASSPGFVHGVNYCLGSSLAQITAPGNGPYQWTAPAGSPTISAQNATMSVLTVTNPVPGAVYTLQATYGQGCPLILTYTIQGTSVSIMGVGTTSSCAGGTGGSATVQASGSGSGYAYTWYALSNNNVVGTGSIVSNLAAGVYSINVSALGSPGCGSAAVTTTIYSAPPNFYPVPNIGISGNTAICVGAQVNLTASGAPNFTWSPGGSTLSLLTVSPSVNTTYSVAGTNSFGCISTAVAQVTVYTYPTVTVTSFNPYVCAGNTMTLYAGGNAVVYNWVNGPLGQSYYVTPNSSAIYTVIGGSQGNLCTTQATVALNVISTSITASSSAYTVCSGATVTLNATGNASSYSWSNGPVGSIYTLNPISTSIYTVTGSNTTNSCTSTKTVAISVVIPTLAVSSSSSVICSGKGVTLTASGADQYLWSNQNTNSVIVETPTATSIYTVTGTTNSLSISCQLTKTIQVNVNPLPNVMINSKTEACKGETVIVSASGAQSYSWSTGATSSTITCSPLPNITYTFVLTGTDGQGCINTATIQVKGSACTGIVDPALKNLPFSIYPNPNKGEFIIQTDREISLILFNCLGQKIWVEKIGDETGYKTIVSGLADGPYFLVIQDGKEIFTEKIVVEE